MLPNEHPQICWENMYLSMKSNGNPKPDQLGLDIDLIDIITTVITELKANDDGHSIQKKRYAKFPCARSAGVTKIAIITNKQYFLLAVQTGFIKNTME